MAAQKGSAFLLKAGGTTVGGLRATSFTINNQEVDVTNKDSSGMRELLAGAGIQSMSISANGVFTDAASEETVRARAAANSIDAWSIVSGNGDDWSGSFLVTSYERSGDHDSEEQFTISLASSGAIAFTAA